MNCLNTRTQMINFPKALKSHIYVDKSGLIGPMNERIGTDDCYICITRPRRFGKTVNANMLGAYYTKGIDARSLFENLQAAVEDTFEEHLNSHNVIYIDFSRMPENCSSYADYISYIKEKLYADIKDAYGMGRDSYRTLSDLLVAAGESYIFILDEWDSVFHRKFIAASEREEFLVFLKGLLKDQPYVELAYMTGVLPIAKYSSGSELNMFSEYNFMNDHIYEDYFGLNENEVRLLCSGSDKVSYEELAYWYDGYFTSRGTHIFNPRSVSMALNDGVCLNYWTESGPMNEVAECIEHNVDEVRDDIVKLIAGIPVEADLDGYSASQLQLDTRDAILSAMVVYGFLSYYDGRLHIPNRELMEKFQRVLTRDSFGAVKEVVDRSKEMLEATIEGNEEKVAAILEEIHDREIPCLKYSDENSLSCVITLAYLYARKDYWIEREFETGKGKCDYIFFPKKTGSPAIILELKMGSDSGTAIKQIKEKNYAQKVKEYKNVLLVGIAYDKKKRHTCTIETSYAQPEIPCS